MTMTIRGAVASTSEPLRTQAGASSEEFPPLDGVELDAVVTLVADHAPGWAKTDAAARADLLQQVIDDTMAAQEAWLAAACEAKGLTPGTTEAGEELYSGIGTFVRMARVLRDSLRDIAKDGQARGAGPRARGARRPSAGPDLPRRRVRPDHVPADDR